MFLPPTAAPGAAILFASPFFSLSPPFKVSTAAAAVYRLMAACCWPERLNKRVGERGRGGGGGRQAQKRHVSDAGALTRTGEVGRNQFSLERRIYSSSVRPSETLKLLSCLGILGEPTGDQLTPSVPCASVRPPAAVCLLLKIKQFERWNERLPAGGPRSSPPSSLFPHTSFGGLKHSLRIYSGATLTVVAGVPVPRYSRIFSFSHP